MSFVRYPKYKDSGVAWLGTLPSRWDVRKFRHLFRESPEKIEVEVVGPMLSVSGYRGIEIKEYDDENRRRLDEDLVGYRIVRIGQLVVNTMWLNYAGLGVSDYEGHVSPAYRCYWISDDLDRRFAHHLLRSSVYVQGYTRLLTGIRPNSLQMSRDDLMEFPILLPPLSDQTRIAEFLDNETAKIDELVTEQRWLIELLKEKRQAVISHAVTKGLNPDAPMKPSGIEGLGDIPAHWAISKMKWVAQMESGHTPDKKISEYWENGDIPWVSLNDTGYLKANDYVSDTAHHVTELGIANSSAHILPPRAVVFSRDATIGRCAITTRPMAVSQHFIAWICGECIIPEFLLLRLRSMTQELDRLTTGATVKTIGMAEVKTLVTTVPPLAEQQALLDWVSAEIGKLDVLTTEAERAIDLLQEHRTALISAAVTGQIDVRCLARSEAA